MLAHEFILCSEVPENVDLDDFYRKKMTIISDDFVLENHIPIRKVKMYNPSLKEDIMGLSYYGTTIIDNEAAQNLKDELTAYCKGSKDLRTLIDLIDKAIAEKKYIIHFGI